MKIRNLLPPHYIEHDFFGRMLSEFDPGVFSDMVVVITHSRYVLPVDGRNVVVIQTAGNEKAETPAYANRVLAVFKHHMDADRIGNVFHIPLPYVGGFVPSSEKPMADRGIDVFFSGRYGPRRAAALDAIQRIAATPGIRADVQVTEGFLAGLSRKDYAAKLGDTRIAFSPTGAVRCECLRLTEALSCGCAVIAEKHPPLRVFIRSPVFFVDNWAVEAPDITRALLASPDLLEEKRQGAIWAWQRYFSPSAVAAFINEEVRKLRRQ